MPADRYLVTGATGFVGANLVHRLVAEGAAVWALGRPSSPRERLAAVADRIHFVTADLTDSAALAVAVGQIQPTVVFHTAAASVFSGQRPPSDAEVLRTNLLGTIHLLEACADLSLRAFVNTGSSSEYGPSDGPMREDHALQPRDAYAVSKCATTLYAAAAGRRGRPVLTLRLFSPYGPLDDQRRFIPTAISAALTGRAVPAADPAVGRDYVYIDDVVEAYLASIERAAALAGEAVNIGAGRQTTLGEIAACIGRLIPQAPPPRWHAFPTSPQDSPWWQADVTKAHELLGWEPKVGLEEGLARAVAWQRQMAKRKT